MRVYFAQVMDNKAYLEHALKVLAELEGQGHSVYFPWRDEGLILEDQAGEDSSMATFYKDVENIRSCDALVAYIDGLGPDSGTCVEIGIAYALGKPIALYTTEFKYLPKGLDLREWMRGYASVTFANEGSAEIQNEPMINNMLLGASNRTVFTDAEGILGWLAALA
ncbi:MAG: nucleoside 2-deoxyribosyltransferase [Propionibacteriaceae bacterium]|jgi:nucleoside 2-deoxyribosyltransferase|nr:nucleoside 2-deoxyribosyltransferase [Propionibacteriaceae bacterium]